jgi:transposase
MKKENIVLSMKEQNRIRVLSLLMDGQLGFEKAREILKCAVSTLYLWKAQLKEYGPSRLIHGNRGRVNANKTADEVVERILKLRREKYYDTNDTHFGELLAKEEGIQIGRSTLQRELRGHGIKAKRKRRAVKYRARRPRKENFGVMLQLDASYHQWLGPMGPWFTLHGAIDDATNRFWLWVGLTETTHGYYELMKLVFADVGMPLSLYTDRHSIFYPVMEKQCKTQQLRGEEAKSQFGRAMEELGIEMIKAYTAQAKGRIERLWETLQDRLVVELRLAGVTTIEGVAAFLPGYADELMKSYAVPAAQSQSVFRKSPRAEILADILCRKEFRVVANDHTVSYQRVEYQIPRPKGWRTLAKKTIEVWDRPDGVLKIVYEGKIVLITKMNTEDAFQVNAA